MPECQKAGNSHCDGTSTHVYLQQDLANSKKQTNKQTKTHTFNTNTFPDENLIQLR